MRVLGIGLDCVHLPRIRRLLLQPPRNYPARTVSLHENDALDSTEDVRRSVDPVAQPLIYSDALKHIITTRMHHLTRRVLAPCERQDVTLLSPFPAVQQAAPFVILEAIRQMDPLTRWSLLSAEERRVVEGVTQFLAVRFAVKEAVYKAMSPHWKLTWHDVALVKSTEGKPGIQWTCPDLKQKLEDDLQLIETHVSVTHDGAYAMAQVMLVGRETSLDCK